MSIRYNWSPVGTMGNLAAQGGLAEYAKAEQNRAFDAARQEDQQQFQAMQQAAQYQQQAALANQAAQQQSARDWRNMQADAFQNAQRQAMQYWQQQNLADRQMFNQGAIDMRLQDRQNWDWQRQGAAGIEQSLQKQMSDFGKMKFTDAGRAKYRDLMKNFNAVQSMRSQAPPEAYAAKLREFSERLNGAGLDSDVTPPPEASTKPLIGPDGKPTGAYLVQHPDGKTTVFQPRADEKTQPFDFSSPEAVGQQMQQRIWTDPQTGARWFLDEKAKPTVQLDAKTEQKGSLDDAYKKITDQIKLRSAIRDDLSERKTTINADGKADIHIPTDQEVDEEMKRQLDLNGPPSNDAEFVRKELKKSPGALARFDSLSRAEQNEQARKVRSAIQGQFMDAMGGLHSTPADQRTGFMGDNYSQYQDRMTRAPQEQPDRRKQLEQVALEDGRNVFVTSSQEDYDALQPGDWYEKQGKLYRKK